MQSPMLTPDEIITKAVSSNQPAATGDEYAGSGQA